MIPTDPFVEVARSFSYKLNVGNYEMREFFCSQKAQCQYSQAERVSEALYGFCKSQVLKAVSEYKQEAQEAYDDMSIRVAGGQPPERQSKPPEANPFVVSQAPKPESAKPADDISANGKADAPSPSSPVEKQEVVQTGETATPSESPVTPAAISPSSAGTGAPATQVAASGAPQDRPSAGIETVVQGVGGERAASAPIPAPETTQAAPRRGRPPKPAPPPQATSAPAPEPAQGGFKATNEDLPENLQTSTASVATTSSTTDAQPPEVTQGTRLSAVLNRLIVGSGHLDKTCRTWMEEVIRTFSKHKGPLPKPPDAVYKKVLPYMEAIVSREPDALKNDPIALAEQIYNGHEQFVVRFIDAWSQQSKDLAIKAVLARCPHTGGSDLMEAIEMWQAEGPLSVEDLRIAIQVYTVSGPAIAAALDAVQGQGKSFSELFTGVDFGTATEKDILSACVGGKPKEPAQSGDLWG